ncbi:MAG: SMP-30/gluconolactonase/LRE family protein [Pirellulales bacterium]|nr:SMP-30/gluconolactonase/LRE family protein [Pirellulales bacterium]
MLPDVKPYDLEKIVPIRGLDHPESIGVGPDGVAYTTGTGCQVYQIDLNNNTYEQFARTDHRCLGSVVDATGNMYAAHTIAGNVLKITPAGEVSVYATLPRGNSLPCANYPAFDRQGHMYLSDSGDWSGACNGHIYKIPPGGGEAQLWFPEPVDTPNAIALDAEEKSLFFVETFGNSVSRVAINGDGSAGRREQVVHLPRHIPDGIAIDESGRIWIACHRPDRIYYFDLETRRLEIFADDWRGHFLRGPTDVAFAGANRDILLAASLDNLVVHRFDNVGVKGLRLNHPKL